ncbi:MAG: hypothetical protein ACXVX8_04835 [Blastococcus sp.]
MPAGHSQLFFEPRFCGPPGTVNGGFACGAVAALCGGAAEVTLRRPIPLARPLTVRHAADAVVVLDDGTPLAEARPAAAETESTAPLPLELLEAVTRRAHYFTDPVFPGCFVCGTDRAPGDGLRIFPGPVAGRPVWAAPWTPDSSVAGADGTVRPEVVWAALDCPAGIAVGEAAGLPDDTTALLGRMTAHVTARPRPGQECRVVAWPLGRNGRKLTAATALLDPRGAVLATARTLWLTVPSPAQRPAVGATR